MSTRGAAVGEHGTVKATSSTVRPPSREQVMAQMGEENFPVAARWLAPGYRRPLMAIYGFARLVDDIGDESYGDRLAQLDWLERELDVALAGRRPEHPVMRVLAAVLPGCPLPREAFERLIEANRMDQAVRRYESFDDLLSYCRLSAAPVGELVLHVFGAASAERIALSDRICAALQVTEHLQDVREDYLRGRIYIPREDLVRFGCEESELGKPKAGEAVRRLIGFEVARARSLMDSGAPLTRRLRPQARLAVAGFVAGGRAALDGIEAAGYDTLAGKPRVRRRAFLTAWLRAARGR